MRVFIFIMVITFVFSCKYETKSHIENESDIVTYEIRTKQIDSIRLASGTIHRIDQFPSEFIQERPVDIWLPDHYSEDKKFTVLYMHDGQMLFDSTTTWNKQEWKVDEWASQLMNEGKTTDFIVVAIHNISKIRWQDYFPEKAVDYLSEEEKNIIWESPINVSKDIEYNADDYLKFITQEVKPFIDANFSVKTDRADTFIAGSSMGGLISMYAVCEYPNIFGGAACISTHWPGIMPQNNNPVPDAFFKYLSDQLPDPGKHKWYFDFGTETLDAYYVEYEDDVNTIFKERGYNKSNFKNLKFEGTDHSENSWNKRLDVPFTFLMGIENNN